MTTFKQFLVEQNDIIDNQNGLGQVPNNANIEYLGLRVKMKPSTFLKLAQQMEEERGSIEFIAEHLQQGGKIASPFLNIQIPESWEQQDQPPKRSDQQNDMEKIRQLREMPQVVGHEGRHRMLAVQKVYGDVPIEVHITFPGGIRARHIKAWWIEQINDKVRNENGRIVTGPLFEVLQ